MMRLGANRDVDDADARSGRRRHYRAESRDWYAPDDVAPYSMPHRTRMDEVQRPDEKTMRGHGRGTRSLDASQSTMPAPRLVRASTDAYRRPVDIVVYEDEDSTSDDWRRSGRRESSPEYKRPHTHVRDHREPSLVHIDGPEDCDEAEIEVIEELDAGQMRRAKRRERHHRHPSRDDYLGSSGSRRRPRRKIIPSSSEDEDVEARHRHSSPDRRSPVRRPVLRRGHSDSPKYEAPRVSVIEQTRPPVASRRNPKVYETREIIREDRSRRPIVITPRESRSSSRRPPSILGSMFGGSGSRPASPERPAKYYECLVCMEEVPANKCAKLKCGHRRCHSCLKRQFKLSTTDPQQMPPKCCTSDHISLRHVEKLFDLPFKKTWNRKFAEYSTRNRIYCPSRHCGEWIRPSNIVRDRESGRKMARCEHCKTRVCVSCNGKWHYSRECPRDEETGRFLEQAKEEGWKRCYSCRAMVELREGCNHMTCRCGAQFCMICGTKWKNCDCPWFNYDSYDDQLEDMNIPTTIRGGNRGVYADEPPSPRGPRLRARSRPRPQHYDEEALMRRLRDQRDDDGSARRRHTYEDEYDVYDPMGGVGAIIGVGNTSGHFMNDHYKRGGRDGPPPAQPGFERSSSGRNYVTGVSRARGLGGGPTESRLADRFSESRQVPDPMAGMRMEAPAPPAPPMINPPHMSSSMMPPPIGMPPPVISSGPPPLMSDGMYGIRGIQRVIVERDPNDYDDDPYGSHSSRDRKAHRRQTSETPMASTLAGLSGRGVGMGRVDVWRKWVEPGAPEGEPATASA